MSMAPYNLLIQSLSKLIQFCVDNTETKLDKAKEPIEKKYQTEKKVNNPFQTNNALANDLSTELSKMEQKPAVPKSQNGLKTSVEKSVENIKSKSRQILMKSRSPNARIISPSTQLKKKRNPLVKNIKINKFNLSSTGTRNKCKPSLTQNLRVLPYIWIYSYHASFKKQPHLLHNNL